MERRIQIEKAAEEFTLFERTKEKIIPYEAFLAGAKWADRTPMENDIYKTELIIAQQKITNLETKLEIAREELKEMSNNKDDGNAEGCFGTWAFEILEKLK